MHLLICVTGNIPEKCLLCFGQSGKRTYTHGAVIVNVKNRQTFRGLVPFASCCNVIYLMGGEWEKLETSSVSLCGTWEN